MCHPANEQLTDRAHLLSISLTPHRLTVAVTVVNLDLCPQPKQDLRTDGQQGTNWEAQHRCGTEVGSHIYYDSGGDINQIKPLSSRTEQSKSIRSGSYSSIGSYTVLDQFVCLGPMEPGMYLVWQVVLVFCHPPAFAGDCFSIGFDSVGTQSRRAAHPKARDIIDKQQDDAM